MDPKIAQTLRNYLRAVRCPPSPIRVYAKDLEALERARLVEYRDGVPFFEGKALCAQDAAPVRHVARARTTDPETSHAAAALVDAGSRRLAVLLVLQSFGPLTSFQVAGKLGRPVQNVSNAFKPLELENLVEVTGVQKDMITNRGRQVYALTDKGRAELAREGV